MQGRIDFLGFPILRAVKTLQCKGSKFSFSFLSSFQNFSNNSVLQNCESKAQCAKDHVGNKVCMVMDAFIVPKTKERNKSVPCYALSLCRL